MKSLSLQEKLRAAATDFLDKSSCRTTSLVDRDKDIWVINVMEYGLYPKSVREAGPFSGEEMIQYAVGEGFDKEGYLASSKIRPY